VPLDDASGTAPIPPGTVTDPGVVVVVVELWLLLLLQAASAVRLASATATPAVLRRNFMSESPFCSKFAGDPLRHRGRASGSRSAARNPYPWPIRIGPHWADRSVTGELAEA
jgi:hypothetical protein